MQGLQGRYAEVIYGTDVYDEQREIRGQEIEYRCYADYSFPVRESIMSNHALFTGLQHAGATPLTDDPSTQRCLG